jgi:hypothetical protein
MLLQAAHHAPGLSPIRALPETGGINAHIEDIRLIRTPGLNDPDIDELAAGVFGKLNALFRLLPRRPKVIAVFQKGPKEVAVVRGKDTWVSTSLVEDRVEDTRPPQ